MTEYMSDYHMGVNAACLACAIEALRNCEFTEGTRSCRDWKESLATLQRLQQRLTVKLESKEQA